MPQNVACDLGFQRIECGSSPGGATGVSPSMRMSALSRLLAQLFFLQKALLGTRTLWRQETVLSLPRGFAFVLLLLLLGRPRLAFSSNRAMKPKAPPSIYSIPQPHDHDSLIQTPLALRREAECPIKASRIYCTPRGYPSNSACEWDSCFCAFLCS